MHKVVKLWGRWNKRTKKLAPLGDIIGVAPYLYTTKEEALKVIARAGAIGEELAVPVDLMRHSKGYGQFGPAVQI